MSDGIGSKILRRTARNAYRNLRNSNSVFLVAGALWILAKLQRDGAAIGSVALGGLHAPEIREARLVIRVTLEVLAVDEHGLAAQVHAARMICLRSVGHGIVSCQLSVVSCQLS